MDSELKTVSKEQPSQKQDSEPVQETKLLGQCHSEEECLSNALNCEFDDEQNTQVIHIENKNNSENMKCDLDVTDSNLNNEDLLNTQVLDFIDREEKERNIMSVQEKASEKLMKASEKSSLDISEKSNAKLLKCGELKETNENAEATNVEIEEVNVCEEIEGKKRNSGDENSSQVTLLDITDTDNKSPNSPDLFGSQAIEDGVKQNSENSLIDYEDFIPSSLASQSEKCGNEVTVHIESANVSTPHKRKMEKVDDSSGVKVPRLDEPIVMSKHSLDNEEKRELDGEEIEVVDDSITGEINDSRKLINEDKNLKKNTLKEGETHRNIDDTGKPEKSVGLNDNELEYSLEKVTSSFKDSRKSVEVVYSSFEISEKDQLATHSENLDVILEENGGDGNLSQSLHLRMSLSPSQLTQSFSDADISKNCKDLQLTLNSEEKNSNGDTLSSTDKIKYPHELNSHSSDEASKNIPLLYSVDDNCDMQNSSADGKTSISNDILVLKNVQNGSEPKQDSDSDVTVLLDTSASSGNSLSENAKHKDMNGTLKRKHLESQDDAKKPALDTVGVEIITEVENSKRSRLADISKEDRSTPDLPQLVSNKGNFQCTPVDISKGTPINVSVSTIDPASLSANKTHDNEDSSLSLRVINRTFALHVRLHVNDDLRQVHSVEMVQCQNLDDCVVSTAVPRESSDGSAADESKNSSPSSVMSLGQFSLRTQSWRLSSSSTSTTSSGHSHIGIKSKSDDWHFTAPMKPAPTRNNKLRNIHYSSEFERDLFELAEKALYVDDADSKLPSLSAMTAATSVSACAPPMTKMLGDFKDLPPTKPESPEHVETPKSSRKLTRGNRNTRSGGRTVITKIIKEVAEEASPQPSLEKTPSDESSGSQRKPRKIASRSSKRTGGSTPSTPVTTDDLKMSSLIAPPSGRVRRNRSDQTQIEKNDSSSQDSSYVYDWSAEGCFSKLVPEAPVFARWTDKRYYPGKIKEKTKDGRWIIEFDDKTVRPLKEEFIIPINILTKGQIVFAYDSDEYEQGIIVEFKLKDGEVQYGVDLDSGRKLFVPRSRLFMSEDQARLLQENMDPKSPATSSPALTTVSCDNIVHHKRPRSTRVLFGNASPSVSGVMKAAKRPSHDTSCSSSVSDSNDKGPTLILDEVGGVDPEVPSSFPESLHTPSGRGKGPGRIKSKNRTPRRNPTTNHTLSDLEVFNKLHDVLGPIPNKGSKMFSGKCFLITHTGVKPIDSTKMNTASKLGKKLESMSSSENEDTDDGIPCNIPFVKEHLKQQLEAGGGIVYENFEDVPEDQYQNCLLITNRPSLTAKYILCLANGIKIIHYLWVIEEAKGSSRVLTSARLPAGWNLEGQHFVQAEATVRTRKQKPLNKKEVGIVNDSQTFVKFWERILELLGANVRHISPGSPEQDRQFSGVDVILADSTCPPEVQDRAREWSIPLVSTVWVTQTLIHWRIRSYTGHPHYRYDYCSSD